MEHNILKGIIATVATFFTWIFGEWDVALQVLVLFMMVDYGTGVLSGVVNKKLSSSTGFNGIAKKGVIFAILIVAVCVDRLLENDSWMFRSVVSYFYIANEGISIVENCASLGLPVPEKIQDILLQLKDGNKKSK